MNQWIMLCFAQTPISAKALSEPFSFMPLYAALKRFTMFLLASCFGIKSNLPQGKVYALKNYHLILVLYIELEGFYWRKRSLKERERSQSNFSEF